MSADSAMLSDIRALSNDACIADGLAHFSSIEYIEKKEDCDEQTGRS